MRAHARSTPPGSRSIIGASVLVLFAKTRFMAQKGSKLGNLAGEDDHGKEMEAHERSGGGRECELIEPLAKELQSECPVCLLVLRDPHVVSCCSKTFCEVCITRLRKANKRCPTCNASNFTTEPDDGLKNALNKVRVRCVNRTAGCGWEGRLRDLDAHLNLSPSNSDHKMTGRATGCEFAGVECGFCGERYKRLSIIEHESQHCTKRPYTCRECQMKGTYETITKVHWFECQRNTLKTKLDELQKHRSKSSWCSPWRLAFLVAVCAMTLAALVSDPPPTRDKLVALQSKVETLEDELARYRQTVGEKIASFEAELIQTKEQQTFSLKKSLELVNTKLEEHSVSLTALEVQLIQSALENAKNLEEEQEERERSYNNTVMIIEELKHKLEEEFSRHVEEVSDKIISVQEKIDKSQNQARVQLEASLAGLKSELQNSIDLLQQSVESSTAKLQQYSAMVTTLETKVEQSTTECSRKLREESERREKDRNDVMVIIGEMKKHHDHHHHGHGGCKKGRRGRGR